jgi:hypothetical protein
VEFGEAVRMLCWPRRRQDGDIDPDLELDALTYFAMTMTFGAFALKALDWPMPDRGPCSTTVISGCSANFR